MAAGANRYVKACGVVTVEVHGEVSALWRAPGPRQGRHPSSSPLSCRSSPLSPSPGVEERLAGRMFGAGGTDSVPHGLQVRAEKVG